MTLEDIKKRFEESHYENAIDTMMDLIIHDGLSEENQELLFNFKFKGLPYLGDDEFYDFIGGRGIISPDEEYNEEDELDCTRPQFFLRQILIAVAIENVQKNIDFMVEDAVAGYYEFYFIEPSSPYNANRLFIENSEVVEAIQEIIDSQK